MTIHRTRTSRAIAAIRLGEVHAGEVHTLADKSELEFLAPWEPAGELDSMSGSICS